MVVFFDMVRGLEELDFCNDSFDWSYEVAPGVRVALDLLALSQYVTFSQKGLGDALTSLRI